MKSLLQDSQLAEYVDAHRFDADDPVLRALRDETMAMGDISGMQISGEQGALMTLLVAAINASTAVEIGTFTGYSSICIARALPRGGMLHCFDQSADYTRVARKYWSRAEVEDRITLHIGNAAEKLPLCFAIMQGKPIDFVFIDADKTGYANYYDTLLPHVREGGLIVFDNMLWHGDVTNEANQEESTLAIRALNDQLTQDDRVESVLIGVADGLHVCRKL